MKTCEYLRQQVNWLIGEHFDPATDNLDESVQQALKMVIATGHPDDEDDRQITLWEAASEISQLVADSERKRPEDRTAEERLARTAWIGAFRGRAFLQDNPNPTDEELEQMRFQLVETWLLLHPEGPQDAAVALSRHIGDIERLLTRSDDQS